MFFSVQTFKCIQKMSAKIAMFKTSSKNGKKIVYNFSSMVTKMFFIDKLFIHLRN